MSKRFYVDGKLVGGTTPDGGAAIPAEAGYGEPETFVGTLAAGNTTISFSSTTKSITIINTHDTQSLQWSTDAGATWNTIAPYGEISEPFSVSSILLRNAGAVGTTYEIRGALS